MLLHKYILGLPSEWQETIAEMLNVVELEDSLNPDYLGVLIRMQILSPQLVFTETKIYVGIFYFYRKAFSNKWPSLFLHCCLVAKSYPTLFQPHGL